MEALAWLNNNATEGVTSDGKAFRSVPYLPELIAAGVALGARIFYLCGLVPSGGPDALLRGLQANGWQDAGSRLDRSKLILRVRNPKLRRSATLLLASTWFGEGDYSHLDAQRAMVRLAREIAERFDRTRMWLTPGRTGAEAWRRTTQDQFPPLPEGLQQLIRSTASQGRFECCPVGDTLPALYQLDSRLEYAASLAGIYTGDEWRHEERPAGGWADPETVPPGEAIGFLGYAPARYHVIVTVPPGWAHVGLLPLRREGRESTQWPATPGQTWRCWADAREVRLALAECWQVTILERIYAVQPEGRATYYRPLKTWGNRLIRLHDDLTASASPALRPLYHAAFRNMVLHGIGWLAMQPTVVTREVDEFEEVPDENTARATARETAGGSVQYEEQGVLSSAAARVAHPELAAQVWGCNRQHLLRGTVSIGGERREMGALTLPRDHVVGMALDCLYVTNDPHWPDDGKLGRYRVKAHVPGPIPAPTGMGDLYRLFGEVEG